jgi:hypothetical protein
MGDPTLIGWVCFWAYLAAALLAGRTAATLAASGWERMFWWSVCALMALLGLNKQLDLQVLFMRHARRLSALIGLDAWYVNVRLAMLAALAVAATAGGFWIYRRARRESNRARIAVMGLAVLAVFVIMRVATFYAIDQRFGLDMTLHGDIWLPELLGIAIVAGAALSRS